MKKHALFIHGGGQGAHKAHGTLIVYLRDALGGWVRRALPKNA